MLQRLEEFTRQAAASVSPLHADKLQQALMARLYFDEPETVIAARFGVRREYLNRARRAIEGMVKEAV